MKKKITAIVTALAMIFTVAGSDIASAAVTDAPTPDKVNYGKLKWQRKLGTGYENSPTPPLVRDEYVYVGANNKLYKLNRSSGTVASSITLAGTMGYAMIPPAYGSDGDGSGKIFVSINGGKIEVIDEATFTSEGTAGGSNGQSNTPITYHNGCVYFGTWGDSSDAYYCVDVRDGDISNEDIKWQVNSNMGFYWAGAHVTDDYAVFGSDSDRSGKATLYSVQNKAAEESSTEIEINTITNIDGGTDDGGIRSKIVYDDGHIFFSTKGGKLYKIGMNADGSFGEQAFAVLSGESTCTPTVYNGRAYVGTKAGKVDVIDINTMSRIYSVSTPGYPQGELLLSHGNDGRLCLYATYNASPGGIYYIEPGESKANAAGHLFYPANKQSCVSPIICDDSGVLYYKNDSGYVMAVKAGYDTTAPVLTGAARASYKSIKLQWNKKSGMTGYKIYRAGSKSGSYSLVKTLSSSYSSYTNTGLATGKTYYYKIRGYYKSGAFTNFSGIKSAKPTLSKTSITTTAGTKKIKVSWKKVSGASGYAVYRATKKSGTYKKAKTISRAGTVSWTNTKLKKGKRYYYKVKAYRIVSGKKVYSAYSNISYRKAK